MVCAVTAACRRLIFRILPPQLWVSLLVTPIAQSSRWISLPSNPRLRLSRSLGLQLACVARFFLRQGALWCSWCLPRELPWWFYYRYPKLGSDAKADDGLRLVLLSSYGTVAFRLRRFACLEYVGFPRGLLESHVIGVAVSQGAAGLRHMWRHTASDGIRWLLQLVVVIDAAAFRLDKRGRFWTAQLVD